VKEPILWVRAGNLRDRFGLINAFKKLSNSNNIFDELSHTLKEWADTVGIVAKRTLAKKNVSTAAQFSAWPAILALAAAGKRSPVYEIRCDDMREVFWRNQRVIVHRITDFDRCQISPQILQQ